MGSPCEMLWLILSCKNCRYNGESRQWRNRAERSGIDPISSLAYHGSQSICNLREAVKMGRSIIVLILVLDVLVCPYACSGSVTAACDSGDRCCPPKQTDSGSDRHHAPSERCDGSCGNCLCGGAVNCDKGRGDYNASENTGANNGLPALAIEPIWLSLTGVNPLPVPTNHRPVLSGAVARALLQSFLL